MDQSACPRFFCVLRILLHSAVPELLQLAALTIPLFLKTLRSSVLYNRFRGGGFPRAFFFVTVCTGKLLLR